MPFELRVGDEAAARVRRLGAVIHQRRLPVDVHAAHWRGLRHRPELTGVAAEIRVRHVDRQIRERAPEVVERRAAPVDVALVAHVDRPVDHDVVRRGSEPRDGRVVADLEVERIRGRPVGAGLEQQRIALRSELVRDLLRLDPVDRRLDLARRHARVEDDHIRAEVRSRRNAVHDALRCRSGRARRASGEQQCSEAGHAGRQHEPIDARHPKSPCIRSPVQPDELQRLSRPRAGQCWEAQARADVVVSPKPYVIPPTELDRHPLGSTLV